MIAAKNEELMLPGCLKSVEFADEVIVIDDYSNDNTRQIAKKFGAKVFKRRLDGFATQKNFGITKSSNDWVLIVDADERVEDSLIKEISAIKSNSKYSAYDIPRKNFIKGKWLKHGGLYPDYQRRLINKNHCKYGTREVHEIMDVNGSTARLRGNIIHYTYSTYKEYYTKVKKYAVLEAQWTTNRPRFVSIPKAFVVRYFVEKGYKDGISGFVSAVLMSYYQLLIWKKVGK